MSYERFSNPLGWSASGIPPGEYKVHVVSEEGYSKYVYASNEHENAIRIARGWAGPDRDVTVIDYEDGEVIWQDLRR